MKDTTTEDVLSNIYNSIFTNDSENSAFICLLILALTILIVIYTWVMLFAASYETKTAIFSSQTIYTFMIVIPIILIFFVLLQFGANDDIAYHSILVMGLLALLTTIIFIYTSLSIPYIELLSAPLIFILGLIIFLGLSIYAAILFNNTRRQIKWSGFMLDLIFYLPCLFNEFITYLLAQVNATKQIVFVLLFFESILVISYLLIPYFFEMYINKHSIVLLKDAVKINSSNELISGYELFKKIYSDELVAANSGAYSPSELLRTKELMNYTLSLWLFVTPHNASFSDVYSQTIEIPVFQYGSGNNMKPMISYYNNLSTNVKTYRVYFTKTGGDPDFELTLPVQKWINFVFNYNNSLVDLFIDGELKRTVNFNDTTPIPVYDSFSDHIVVGTDMGLQGAIGEVVLYKVPLTKSQIAANYNLIYQNITNF